MEKSENRKLIEKNLMTIYTYNVLKEALKQAISEKKRCQLAIGEAAGRESDWHDNAAFDEANRQFDIASLNESNLNEKLKNAEFISPRVETDTIGLGNSVIIKYLDSSKNETFTILGQNDAGLKPNWISYLSPLGKSLVGKREGDSVDFFSGTNERYSVRINKILPGVFDQKPEF